MQLAYYHIPRTTWAYLHIHITDIAVMIFNHMFVHGAVKHSSCLLPRFPGDLRFGRVDAGRHNVGNDMSQKNKSRDLL